MSSFSKHIGIDEDDIQWYHLAACRGMPINWFYDDYESDKETARQVDQVCLHCPVIKVCHDEGVANKEKGVWGGVFMNLGRPDKQHNSHKDPEILRQMKRLHGRKSKEN